VTNTDPNATKEPTLRRSLHRLLLAVIPLLFVSAFTVNGDAGAALSPQSALRGGITVSAASSLTAAFTEIGLKFHKIYPHTSVTFNFGSSTTLATQILGGAPSDVYASADLTDMDTLVTAGYVRVAPKIFARNTMELAVKPGNPSHITGLTNLANAGVVALCGTTVPCGIYAANLLKRAGVTIPTASITRQPNSTSTVEQVSYGDAVAAVVYVTDVHGQGSLVSGVKIPFSKNTIADYPIARLTSSTNSKVAEVFVAFVQSLAGQRSLKTQGFLAP
jgi:molybdate transport system substrate-binding protein